MFRLTLSITFAISAGLTGSLALATTSNMDTTQLFTFQGDTASAIAAPEANATDWQLRTVIPSDRLPVAFDYSGQRLLTLSPDMLRVWNTQVGEAIAEIVTDGETRIMDAALSPDGSRVATIVETTSTAALRLQIWNIETGTVVSQPLGTPTHPGQAPYSVGSPLNQLAFAPNGNLLTQTVLAFDAENDPVEVSLRQHDGVTAKVAYSLATLPNVAAQQFAFSPDGEWLAGVSAICTGQGSAVRQVIDVWQWADGTHQRRLEPMEDSRWSLVDVVFNPAGHLQVLSQWLYDVQLDTWSVTSGERLDRLTRIPDIDRQDRFGRLSPDGHHYFARSDVAGTRLINLDTQTVQNLPVYAQTAVFDQQGQALAIATQTDIQIYTSE
jgi:WD40 repeat protein